MRYNKCSFCDLDFSNIQSYANIANHIRWCDLNPKRIKEKKSKKQFCTRCGKEIPYNKRKIRCNECGHKHTKETRLQMSNSRIDWLKKNPEKHPWRKKAKFTSIPCENFKKYLDSIQLKYISEYDTYKETNRNFSIDIAFPDIKVGIEINGNQHYNKNGTLKKYYQERHNIIESCGWKLLEIHYTDCFKEENMKSIISYYKQPDYTEYFEKYSNNKYLKTKFNRKNKNEERIKTVLSSNIDFSKYGWVNEVAKLFNIKPQKINSFMKKYMKDFYEEKCFKRKFYREVEQSGSSSGS